MPSSPRAMRASGVSTSPQSWPTSDDKIGGWPTPSLALGQQREYVDLWRRSGFLVKQQFYASARSLVMISAYSMEEMWAAIGYDGPVLSRTRT